MVSVISIGGKEYKSDAKWPDEKLEIEKYVTRSGLKCGFCKKVIEDETMLNITHRRGMTIDSYYVHETCIYMLCAQAEEDNDATTE